MPASPVTPVGANQWAVRGAFDGRRGAEVVDALCERGLDGVQLDTVTRFSSALDTGELAEIGQHARARSFYIEGGVMGLDPLRPWPDTVRAGEGDFRAGLIRELRATAAVVTGTTSVRAFIADPWARGRAGARWADSWPVLRAATAALLEGLRPTLHALGLRIAIENHGDVTTAQLIDLVSEVDPEVYGICLDTANLAMALENPVEAARRAAPHTFATHLKDGIIVARREGGLVLHARPCGEGVFPIAEILAVLEGAESPLSAYTLEDHDALFPIPVQDPAFVDLMRRDGGTDLAAIDELVTASRGLIDSGVAPNIEELEAVPWSDQEVERVRRGATWLRRVPAERAEP